MFDTFTMRSTPAASGRVDGIRLQRDLVRVGDDTRNRARTPANAAASDAASPRSPSATGRRNRVDRFGPPHDARAGTPSAISTAHHSAAEVAGGADHENCHRGSLAVACRTCAAPRPGPGIGRELTPQQELACALRILAADGWQREHVRPHHVGDRRRRHVGATRGACGGTRCTRRDDHRASTPTATCSKAKWDVTPARPHPHRAAPRPPRRRGRSCTTIRTTRPCSRRSASCRGSCTRTRACSTASSRSSTSTRAIEGAAVGAELAEQVGDASGVLLANHGAIVTAPDDRGGVLQGGDVRAHVPAHLRLLRAGREPRRARARDSARRCKALLRRRSAARVLGRRGAPAARARARGSAS